ncbi:hypothetical protein M378DRAFT_80369 [Amanita muscaria Koide BX008]|uniref:Tyr recombinase domain-containing protein n=1 Tax=Amanita muscaria (strain Koide BX008) TaxID=946122 RepID=A0A0C2WN54_AMAMK|nr:hypothetical protein M378DRAFT_80369 [Amanita muscaria Koide BX008]
MLTLSRSSRQPVREPWTLERLLQERSIALGMCLADGTVDSYTSALNSYLTFCELHHFSLNPTPDTLSLYVTWQSAHIKPDSVNVYLSGLVHLLEAHFPDVRASRNHPLVTRTLAGCKRRFGTTVNRKSPVSSSDIARALSRLPRPWNFDDLLFVSLLLVAFLGLLRLGELTQNNSRSNYRRVIARASASITPSSFTFTLPAHKADRFFEGSRILITARNDVPDPVPICQAYLQGRDSRFPFHPQLWLRSDGSPPTRIWFLKYLHTLADPSLGGHSLRAGGATDLALHGTPLAIIQAAGRWASEAFQIYIRRNPFLMDAVLHAHH